MNLRNKYTKVLCTYLPKKKIDNEKKYSVLEMVFIKVAADLNIPVREVKSIVMSALQFVDILLRFSSARRPIGISKMFYINIPNFGKFQPSRFRIYDLRDRLKQFYPESSLLKTSPIHLYDKIVRSFRERDKTQEKLKQKDK